MSELKGIDSTIITNRKAAHEYFFVERFTAGIILKGTEVKSLRQGKANFQDAYCLIEGGEVFIKNLTIQEYTQGTYNNHIPTRARKLLLNRKEIRKLTKQSEEKGMTIVPVRLFFNEKNLAKLEIALAKGKKSYDKRDDLKSKDSQREIDRALKYD